MGCKRLASSGAQRQRSAERPAASRITLLLVVFLTFWIFVDGFRPIDDAVDQELYEEDEEEEDPKHLRNSIYKSLGLKKAPDPTKANISQAEYERAHTEYLTRLRRSAQGDGLHRGLFTINATEELTHEGIALSFPISPDSQDELLVESASLRLLLDHELDSSSTSPLELVIRVYRSRGPSSRARKLVSQRSISDPQSVRRRWIEFDLTEEVEASLESTAPIHLLVQLWSKEQKRKEMQLVRGWSASWATLNVHAVYPIHPHQQNQHQLQHEHQHQKQQRNKRSAGISTRERLMSLHRGRRTECRGAGKKCCRHRMTVMFKDLEGFDFIVQPKSFDAGYCKGRCPPRYNPAHHHALLQSLIWKENKTHAPRPCCAPSKLAELEILYFDDDDATKLKVSNWKDMRVLECACS